MAVEEAVPQASGGGGGVAADKEAVPCPGAGDGRGGEVAGGGVAAPGGDDCGEGPCHDAPGER